MTSVTDTASDAKAVPIGEMHGTASAKGKHRSTALSAVKWTLICNVSNLGMRLVGLLVLSRILSQSDFGVFSIATSIVQLTELIILFGTGPSLLQLKTVGKEHYQTATALALSLGATCLLIVWILSAPLAKIYGASQLVWILPYLAIGLSIKSAVLPQYYILMREMRFKEVAFVDFASTSLGYTSVSLGMALSGYGVASLVGAFIFQSSIFAILLLSIVRVIHRPRIHLHVIAEAFRFSTGIWLTRLMNYVARNGDYLVLGLLATPAIVGVYSRSFGLMQILVTTVIDALEKVSLPALSHIKDNRPLQQQVLIASWEVTVLAYVPFGMLAYAFSEDIILVALGAKWHDAVPVFAVFAACIFLRAGYKTAGSVLYSQGRAMTLFWCQSLYAILVLMGTAAGFSFGLVGSAVGVCLALLTNYLVLNYLAARMLNLKFTKLFGCLIVAIPHAIPAISASALSNSVTSTPGILHLAIGFAVWLSLTCLIMFLLRQYRSFFEFRKLLSQI